MLSFLIPSTLKEAIHVLFAHYSPKIPLTFSLSTYVSEIFSIQQIYFVDSINSDIQLTDKTQISEKYLEEHLAGKIKFIHHKVS